MPYRKPLIVIAPKKLLKYKNAGSDLSEFGEGTRWYHLIKDKGIEGKPLNPTDVKKVILCSGQVYYDLEAERVKSGRSDVAILRVESLCPFPFKEIVGQLQHYKNANDVVWAQEEPKNAGSWTYAQPRMWNILDFMKKPEMTLTYAGRPIMAATAVGYVPTHNGQLQELIENAFA
jgi:2-oxoglutarate dehydrogenase E1 component